MNAEHIMHVVERENDMTIKYAKGYEVINLPTTP